MPETRSHPLVAEEDFLPCLLGTAGNVHNVFAAIRRACEDHGADYEQFRRELDEESVDHAYEDVLDKCEAWFGPQESAEEYRERRALLAADTA